MKLQNVQLTAIFMAIALGGCATARFDAEKNHQVKKLAILGIEIQQQQPTDNLGIKKLMSLKEMKRVGDTDELQEMSKNIFNDIAGQIQKKTGWTVVSHEKMLSNPEYSAKVNQKMSGARLTSMTGQGYEIVTVKGELDAYAFKALTHEERAKLARALGADAFAIVTIYEQIDQPWLSLGHISGDAEFTFWARSNMDVYGLQSDEPIWRTQNVDGDKTVKSTALPNLPVRGRIAKLGKDAAAVSFAKLVDSYK